MWNTAFEWVRDMIRNGRDGSEVVVAAVVEGRKIAAVADRRETDGDDVAAVLCPSSRTGFKCGFRGRERTRQVDKSGLSCVRPTKRSNYRTGAISQSQDLHPETP